MYALKYAMILACIAVISVANAQKTTHHFNPDGSAYPIDTTKVITLGQLQEASGYKFLGSDILNDKKKTLFFYAPLSYKPIVILAKDSLDVLQAMKSYNKSKYLNSDEFKYDFESLLELNFTKSDIIELLGAPIDESDSEEIYTILTYTGFSIRCLKSSDPKYCTIDKLTRYNFSGAKKSGIGIANFSINLSDSNEDYVTGFRGDFLNTSKKKIKYLYITIRAVNAVDDLVATKTAKAIGPIGYNEIGSYNYENFFFSKIIESIKITSIKIQYFDGTLKIVSGPLLKGSFLEK